MHYLEREEATDGLEGGLELSFQAFIQNNATAVPRRCKRPAVYLGTVGSAHRFA